MDKSSGNEIKYLLIFIDVFNFSVNLQYLYTSTFDIKAQILFLKVSKQQNTFIVLKNNKSVLLMSPVECNKFKQRFRHHGERSNNDQ